MVDRGGSLIKVAMTECRSEWWRKIYGCGSSGGEGDDCGGDRYKIILVMEVSWGWVGGGGGSVLCVFVCACVYTREREWVGGGLSEVGSWVARAIHNKKVNIGPSSTRGSLRKTTRQERFSRPNRGEGNWRGEVGVVLCGGGGEGIVVDVRQILVVALVRSGRDESCEV